MGVLRLMGGSARWRVVFIAAVLALGAAVPHTQASAQMPLLASCQPKTDTVNSFTYRFCTAYVPSFDGVPLDTDLTLPSGATPAGGYPLIVMMHGWGNDKSQFEANDFCTTTSAEMCKYNNVWFASRGYAVMNYAARGFHGSCGPGSPNALSPACATGWTHLADTRWEIHDTQYLAGLLVDAGAAKPSIGVTGLSYGAGQSWLLAVLADKVMKTNGKLTQWKSPHRDIAMNIAAAIPRYGWTDLVDALEPNGRSSDMFSLNGDRTNPLGIEKKSFVDFLYGDGLATARYAPPGVDPTADLTTWYNEISAGETPAQSQYAPAIVTQITQFRSAYYQDGLIAGDTPGRETPIFAVQGWTDALFPEVQGASMVEKLRGADPNWPAYLYVSDLGHPPANNGESSEWNVINRAATAFFDLHLLGVGGSDPSAIYQEQEVTCGSSAGTVHSANTLPGVSPSSKLFPASPGTHTTASPAPDSTGPKVDPLAFYIANGQQGGCITLSSPPADTAASTSWSFPVCSSLTMVGEPSLQLNGIAVGTDAELNARLWDVAPNGSATLVTRGAYRWNGAPGSTSKTYALQGSGWTFAAGDNLILQVTQNDGPYLRPDNYASSFAYSDMKLTLPTTSAVSC